MFEGLKKALGLDPNERKLKRYRAKVAEINALEPKIREMTDEAIKERALAIRTQLSELAAKWKVPANHTVDPEEAANFQEGLSQISSASNEHLTEVFALAREMAHRKLGLRPFDVQLMGAMALHEGNIAEMKTGEGKTLVAPLAVILNAYTGRGVHVVTVNDYLAKRDAEWMKPLYEAMGCSVGVIYAFMDQQERKKAYDSDITYGTNSEFGFDYLRDNMVNSAEEMVQRGHNFCIVDEVDSILIDEARTPLIISGPSQDDPEAYRIADDIACQLEGYVKDPNEFQSRNFLEKQEIVEPDADYQVDEKEKSISLTSQGIAKCEKLLNVPGLFSDMGHADMAHRIQQAIKAHSLFKRDVDYVVKDGEIVIVDEFTGRLMFGRRYSDGLHQAIEAKEKVTVGKESQTLATITLQNYFRLYAKLAGMTGTAATEAEEFKEIYGLGVVVVPTNQPVIREDKTDLIYRTKVEKFAAVADVIEKIHATGRPILVGTASVSTSENVSRLLKARKVPHRVLNARYHEMESAIVAQAGRLGAVTVATNMAGRGTDIVLGGNPDFLAKEAFKERNLDPIKDKEACDSIRREFADACAKEKEKVLQLGGLCIIGTERHEARRIDNQLRGRSGRQGDPGASQFYLSLEDDLLRLFGADQLQGLLGRLGMEEGEAMEAKLLSKAIESSQKKVEMVHYDIRRQLLLYDNVMNQQREAVYGERSHILLAEDLIEHGRQMAESVVEDIMDAAFPEDAPSEPSLAAARLQEVFWPGVENHLAGVDDRHNMAKAREAIVAEVGDRFDQRVKELTHDVANSVFRFISLHVLDGAWKEHLLGMDALREGIGLRAVGQKDPLMEYNFESYNLFKETMARVRENIIKLFFKVSLVSDEDRRRQEQSRYHAPSGASMPLPGQSNSGFGGPMSRGGYFGAGEGPAPKRVPKVGRNDPCPCGSGKKYKNCCGRNA